jgi:HD-like signal output (HDOD) protein
MAALSKDQILKTIRQSPRVPAPSQTVSRILSLTQNPDCNLTAVAELIQRDGALTVQLLRQANSSLYATAHATSSVKDACVRLGIKRVRAAIINDHVVSGLGKACPPGFDASKYWQSALATSVAARDLCAKLMPSASEDAGTAGLLCDIGIGLLAYGISNDYKPVLTELAGSLTPKVERIERRVIGVTHSEIGSAILADWKLDQSVISAVRFHHEADPDLDGQETELKFCRIVSAAVTCSELALFGTEIETVDRLFTQVGSLCPNPDEVVGTLLDQLVVHIQQTAESLAVELGSTDDLASNLQNALEGSAQSGPKMSFKPMDRSLFET